MKAKPIKVLGISGSPRNMATAFMVQEALRIAKEEYDAETDYFSAKGKELAFCIHCDFCIRTKEGCVHQDDISAELYGKMTWADAWIMGLLFIREQSALRQRPSWTVAERLLQETGRLF